VLNAYPNAKGIRAAEGIINQHLAKNGVAPTGVLTNGQSQGESQARGRNQGRPAQDAPDVPQLLADKRVRDAIEQAWNESQVDDADKRHEEGGWVYANTETGALTTKRAPAGGQAAIDLNRPPSVRGHVVVAKFHTHPNPTNEDWEPGRSPSDERNAIRHGVPSIIRADDGIHVTGPQTRRGGLRVQPGFPQ